METVSEQERYKIELLSAGKSTTQIGKMLGRDRHTIEMEIKRGSVQQVDYLWREHMQ